MTASFHSSFDLGLLTLIPGRLKRLVGESPMASSAGVTIIELLVSIAIVGVLAGLGIPQLSGIYSNQLVINTANELVTDIKQAQNKALANDQASNGPSIADCSATDNYIDAYGLQVNSSSQYRVYARYRTTSKTGQTCSPDPVVSTVITRQIPSTVQLSIGEFSSVEYDTTSGRTNVVGHTSTSGQIRIYSTRTSMEYFVCVDEARRAYAQTTAC